MKVTKKIVLSENDMPTQWYNITADLKNKPLPSHLFLYGKKLEKLDIITHRNTDSIYLGSLMRRTGLTQVQIAAALDVSLRTVTYMRSPRRRHEVSKSLREALERLVEECESEDLPMDNVGNATDQSK